MPVGGPMMRAVFILIALSFAAPAYAQRKIEIIDEREPPSWSSVFADVTTLLTPQDGGEMMFRSLAGAVAGMLTIYMFTVFLRMRAAAGSTPKRTRAAATS